MDSYEDYKETLASMLPQEFTPEQSSYKDSTYTLVSTVAYLIGVPERIFQNEVEPPKPETYQTLSNNKNARIIRNLCMLRTAVERNYKKIYTLMSTELRSLSNMPEIIPFEWITELSDDGIQLKSHQKLNHHIIDFNRLITDRINNCQELFPIWINWSYIREMFIMPNGLTEDGIKKAASKYYEYRSFYPYQVYINWPPTDSGNILFNDKKFVTLLYRWHNDVFTDYSKVSDVSDMTKNNIYDFIERSGKTVFVVDCENSDPYRLCATLKNLNEEYLKKISKIILFDDVNTATAWRILEDFTKIPIEHILIERIKYNKSLVDIKLTALTCMEHYQNNVDSFVLVSSDSDYWGLISSLPNANFLVMLEHGKTGPDIKDALYNSGIVYCYIDDFYSGNSEEIKINALLREARRYLDQTMNVNVNRMMEAAYRATRIEMSDAEKKQFYNKYIKPLYAEIDENGNITIQLRKK